MKIKIASIVLIFMSLNCLAQEPDWLWAKDIHGVGGTVLGNSIKIDASGNMYITGFFGTSSVTFDTTVLTNTSIGRLDIFLVKYDPDGNVLWAKSFGSTEDDYSNSLTIDIYGNILIAGVFNGSSIVFGSTTLINNGNSDTFVAKYDSDGNILWVKGAGGNSEDDVGSVVTDNTGNVYSVGNFISSSITFGMTTLTRIGGSNVYLVKYDSNGNVVWVKQGYGTGNNLGRSLAIDDSQNILIVGHFDSPSITFNSTVLARISTNDLFLVKYDSTGNVLWAKNSGANSYVISNSVAIDPYGNSYVSGSYAGTSFTIGSTVLSNSGVYDIFLTKYDFDGNVLWAKKAGGNGEDHSYSLTIDAIGNPIITGSFAGTYVAFETSTLENEGESNLYVAKYDSSGSVLWVKGTNGIGVNAAYSVTTDAEGAVYSTGYFGSEPITFDSIVLNAIGFHDMFIAKLGIVTGIAETILKNNFIIAPNPFTSQAVIIFDEEQRHTTIRITDILGKEIKKIKFSGTRCTIEKDEMKAGFYFLTIDNEKDFIMDKKILIQ